MSVFFQSIPLNIKKFFDQKYSEGDDLQIDVDTMVQLVYACVNGVITKQEMQYEIMIDSNEEQIPEKKAQPKPRKERLKTPKQKTPEKPKKFMVPKSKTPEKKVFIEKHEMPEKKMPARYLMNLPKKPIKPIQEQIPDLPEPLDFAYLERNRKNIETRLEYLYKHYCSQQQNLGAHTTFDRIKS